MAKVLAPNKQFNGERGGVSFVEGVGETEDKNLIDWFKNKGYEVEEEKPKPKKPAKKEEDK